MAEAHGLPIGARVVVDRRRLLDLVDQMRAAVPSEIKEARELLAQRDEVLRQAHEDAAIVRARGEEEVERRLSESEVVKAAEARAQMLVQEAQARIDRLQSEAEKRASDHIAQAEKSAAQQMDEADRYALEMLRKLEQQLAAFSANVRSGIETLQAAPAPARRDAALEEALPLDDVDEEEEP